MTERNSKVVHIGSGTFVVSAGFPICAVLDKLGVPYQRYEEPRVAFTQEIVEFKPIEIPDFSPLLDYSYSTKRSH